MTTNPTLSTFESRRAEQARCQEAINAVYAEQGAGAAMLAIRLRAELDHAAHRQYDGFWSGPEWTLASVDTDLRSKGGEQALRGDVVLFRRFPGLGFGPSSAEFYSVRLGWMCSAAYGYHVVESVYTRRPVEAPWTVES